MTFGRAVKLFTLGAPLHPILVHFTIALVSASLFFDSVGFLFEIAGFPVVGWWTLCAAFVMTNLTVATGVKSRMNLPVAEGEARSFLRSHLALGLIFFGMLTAVVIWRAALWESGSVISWFYLLAIGATAAVMGLQGYLGGELVYRYGAEVEGEFRHLPEKNKNSEPPALYPNYTARETEETG